MNLTKEAIMLKDKNKLLILEVLIDESFQRTAEQRENFLTGYITSIPGCKVVHTEIRDADF
jgi:hypothetical protein